MPQPARRRFWERHIQATALRVNASAWLDGFMPWFFGGSSACALVLYSLRRQREAITPAVWLLFALWTVAALLVLFLRRKQFFGRTDARVFLEYQLGLNAGLSAAAKGIAPWPEPLHPMPKILRSRARSVFAWVGLSALLLVASLQLPLPPLPRNVQAAEKSPALAEVENLLEELKQSDLADAESLERLASEARQLGNRPLDQQYSHSALEAADQLKNETLNDTQNLAKNFDEAAKALEQAAAESPKMSDADAKKAAQNLQTALQGLRSGQLSANEKLSSQLKNLNASKLQQMSKDQLQNMAQAMQRAGNQAKGIAGAQKRSQVAKGNGEKSNEGEGMGSGTEPGNGGDPAPLAFSENASPNLAGKQDDLTSSDYSRASLGDNIQTTDGKHEVDPSKAQGRQNAGTVSGKAQGGDAVWVNKLTPAERAALKDFFK